MDGAVGLPIGLMRAMYLQYVARDACDTSAICTERCAAQMGYFTEYDAAWAGFVSVFV